MPDMTIPGTPDQQPYRVPVTPPQPPVPPQYGQPVYYPPVPPKKKGLPGWGIALIVIGAVVLVFCGGGMLLFAIGVGSAASAPKPTVHVTSCSYDGVIATYATYTLTNNDSKPHDYYVEGTVGHSPAMPDVLKNVQPHETVTSKMMGTEQGDCRITNIDQQ